MLSLVAFRQRFHSAEAEALAARRAVAASSLNTLPKGGKSTQRTQQAAAVGDVVSAANAFLATLSATQTGSTTTSQTGTVLQPFSAANVIKWSNFPIAGYQGRIGIRFDALTATQRTAALAVIQAATGTAAGEGFDEIQQIRAADDWLVNNGSSSATFSSNYYFIAFLGQPSTTGTWMLQCGGHHSATNITFGSGNVTGVSPKFEGVEPLTYSAINSSVLPTGTACAPINQEQSTMLALLNGLTTAQKTTAKLSQSFGDVVVGPQKDGQFPATKVGLSCSQLTAAQQQLVVNAMATWVKDADDATGTQLLDYYQSQLAGTYLAYSGTGNINTNGDYVRLDGPNVWIEFIVQTGAEIKTQVHYHTLYRDRARDYGGNFYGSYTTVLGTRASATGSTAATVFTAFPNPVASGQGIDVVLTQTTQLASYLLRNSLGQTVVSGTFSGVMAKVPTVGLSAGTYLLTVQPSGEQPVTSRLTLQ